jgi:hypothetical protein
VKNNKNNLFERWILRRMQGGRLFALTAGVSGIRRGSEKADNAADGQKNRSKERKYMETLKKIWNAIEHNRFTIVCPVMAAIIWLTAVGCTPVTFSPTDQGKLVNARELNTEYEVWLAQNKVMETKFTAAGKDLEEQAVQQEQFKQFLLTLASGNVADWSGLVQLIVGGGLLGALSDNVRKSGVIGGLAKANKLSRL